MSDKSSDAQESGGWTLVVVGVLLATVVGFVLVGWLAARPLQGGFDWELASIFGTALGTVLLAVATGFLGLQTVAQARAARLEIGISQQALLASARPLLLDVPSSQPGEGGASIAAGMGPPEDPDGYITVSVPVKNVGQGLALIRSARVIDSDVGFGQPSDWSAWLEKGVPSGETATLRFQLDLDVGDALNVDENIGMAEEPISVSVEIDYTDIDGRQPARARFTIRFYGRYGQVTTAELFDGQELRPSTTLVRSVNWPPRSEQSPSETSDQEQQSE